MQKDNTSRWLDIFVGVSLLLLGIMIVLTFFEGRSLDNKNDACLEAGGVLVKVYGGYKCYSTDFRQELKVTVE